MEPIWQILTLISSSYSRYLLLAFRLDWLLLRTATTEENIILQLTPNGFSVNPLRLCFPQKKMNLFFIQNPFITVFITKTRFYEKSFYRTKESTMKNSSYSWNPKWKIIFYNIGHLKLKKSGISGMSLSTKALWPSANYISLKSRTSI